MQHEACSLSREYQTRGRESLCVGACEMGRVDFGEDAGAGEMGGG